MTEVAQAPASTSKAKVEPEPEDIVEATAEMFDAKKPVTSSRVMDLDGRKVRVRLQAIGRIEYDAMLNKCPPSTKQRAEGASYDQETFAPMLLARVIVAPQQGEVWWRNTWKSPNWNRAELGDLFLAAVEVSSQGLNLGPIEND